MEVKATYILLRADMDNSYFRVYDTIRIYNQKIKLLEVTTWVEKKENISFANFKSLNQVLICEDQL